MIRIGEAYFLWLLFTLICVGAVIQRTIDIGYLEVFGVSCIFLFDMLIYFFYKVLVKEKFYIKWGN